ncbi:sigma-54-dependent Fis family transcriptional regulator [Clostridium sp. BSD9I1]|uniref:sigma-54 interaction domain-containing protein n=1 Tax=Clostridium sp. BSD9I1 TaxID=2003589 RepID=UPI0016471B31|nr:sigma 54-interacting transcriptional regulator [Clostridium sp. BSD9I1]
MGKKIIGIGALNENTRQFYEETLKNILGDKGIIKSYNFSKQIEGKVDVDVLLISTPLMINMVKKHINVSTKLIFMNRTFSKEAYEVLKSVPKGTKALLVNNGIDTTFETISLIYALGFEFELYPYYPGQEILENIYTAITTDEENLVPKNISRIYNIGHMVYDMRTLIDLLNELDLNNNTKDEMLHNYQKTIIPLGKGIHDLFGTSIIIKSVMNTSLDLIDDGVLEVDNNKIVIMANKKFREILCINEEELLGKSIDEIFEDEEINFNSEITDLLIKHGNNKLIINFKTMDIFNKRAGYILIIKNVTELRKLEEQVRREVSLNGYIAKYNIDSIIGVSEKIHETKEIAKKMALADASVLIIGESGTGKELFAQSIHNNSKRSKFPFVAINCAALPNNLIESELFGYEGGAFTGAKKEGKPGVFEQAHLGTLFLDEIGDLDLSIQARLLRVLQEGEIVRIGSTKIRKVNVRIISATNKDLFQLAKKGEFRWDLYYRLNVFPLNIPPLRSRKEDTELIFRHFLKEFGCNKKIDNEVWNILKQYEWPGNIRELRNLAEYLCNMGSNIIVKGDLPYNFKENKECFASKGTENLSEEKKAILKIVYSNMLLKKKIGRSKIAQMLEYEDILLTEREVRNKLEDLKAKGYIEFGVGRQGTRITQEGIMIIENYTI